MKNDQQHPERLRRSESFLGIHFDFHAGEDCTEVGKHVTREMVEAIIDQVHPDYVQCDCKGHSGLSSYPTKVGYAAPGFVKDQLRIWRDVTAERGVGLYMHYSGVWDMEAMKHHPSWARVDEKGKRDKNNASVFGPYVDKLLIPQLKELCDEYEVDGMWIDGECWATCQDYGKEIVEAFLKQTGLQEVPRKLEDPHFYEYTEFCREGFRRYLRHYVDELHRHNPSFQIASNWAYSSFMPEPVTANVDFISGDYSLQDSLNAARLEGRCMARQGKPWDLMAWSFSSKWGEGCFSTKSVTQLQQEAAVVLALGGGFQAYFRQKRDGSIHAWQMKLMSEVAKFCRARQPFCHRAEAVPQIALLNSSAWFYRRNRRVFSPWEGLLVPLRGVLQCLLESQHSVEVLSEHHLAGRLREYPLIILPECDYLEPKFKKELLTYVAEGGNLLLVGPKCAALFKKQLQVSFKGEPEEKAQWLEHRGWLGGMKALSQSVKLGGGSRAFGKLYSEDDTTGPYETAASLTSWGKGKIAATYLNFGERYCNAATTVARDFLSSLVRELFPKPVVEVEGSHAVDVSVNQLILVTAENSPSRDTVAQGLVPVRHAQGVALHSTKRGIFSRNEYNGKLMVNLVNTSGPHANTKVYVYDEIPPVGPLRLTVRRRRPPKKVTCQPAGQSLPFEFSRGEVRLTIPVLEIYDIIEVE